MPRRVLVVTRDRDALDVIHRALADVARIAVAADADEATSSLAGEPHCVGLVLGDDIPDAKAASALATLRRRFPDAPALHLTKAPHPTVMARAFTTNTGYVCSPLTPEVARTFAMRVTLHTRIGVPDLERRADGIAVAHDLSVHEAHILALVLRGYDRGQLASALGVSENTLKTRVRRLLRKFGVRSLRALLASVVRRDERPSDAPPPEAPASDSRPKTRSGVRAVGSE